jgi:hypothetical protein
VAENSCADCSEVGLVQDATETAASSANNIEDRLRLIRFPISLSRREVPHHAESDHNRSHDHVGSELLPCLSGNERKTLVLADNPSSTEHYQSAGSQSYAQ